MAALKHKPCLGFCLPFLDVASAVLRSPSDLSLGFAFGAGGLALLGCSRAPSVPVLAVLKKCRGVPRLSFCLPSHPAVVPRLSSVPMPTLQKNAVESPVWVCCLPSLGLSSPVFAVPRHALRGPPSASPPPNPSPSLAWFFSPNTPPPPLVARVCVSRPDFGRNPCRIKSPALLQEL